MKFAKRLKVLSSLFFLILWIPFAMIMVTGPFSETIWGPNTGATRGFFWTMMPWVVLTVGLGLAAVLLSIVSLLAGGMSNITIMAKGQDAEATVLGITDTGTSINDNPVIDFSLEVRPPGSAPFKAVARKTVSLIDVPSIQPGKTVRVKYVPGKEHVAIIDARDLEMLRAKGLIKDESIGSGRA